jgi:AcrR family transcriptional regulator
MTATSVVHDAPPAGRRERKKLRTREALVDAAFTLFQEKGFEATTVEEIADAVDVSSRTFFRYFASKEEVALGFQEEQRQAMMKMLAERPADEPVVTALRRAIVAVAQECERGGGGFDAERFGCMHEMMASSPALLAGSLEHAQKKQSELTQLIADRMGADSTTDLRPHVVAAAATCTFQAIADAWRSGPLEGLSISETMDQAFALLEEGINYPSVLAD